jgi:hypothetical protein
MPAFRDGPLGFVSSVAELRDAFTLSRDRTLNAR